MGEMTFCEIVLEQLPRATGGEREAIRAELEDHLADHRDALTEKGMDPEEALQKAEEAMGDPEEIGKALNAQLSPFWLWVKRVAQGVVYTILIIAACYWFGSSGKLVTGPWDVLAGAWENWQVRQGDAWELVLKDHPVGHEVVYSWRCWEVMRVREELVCLVRVDMAPIYEYPGYYRGRFYFCTYNEDPFTPANGGYLECLTIAPESEDMIDINPGDIWGWNWPTSGYDGFQVSSCAVIVMEGDAYVDVSYDRFGTYATMRCPIVWESWDREVEP